MSATRWFLIVALGAVFSLACGCLECLASTSLPYRYIHIRENNTNYLVRVDLASGGFVMYFDDENCGNSAHDTEANNWFEHGHVSHGLPIWGKDISGTYHEVTVAKIDAFWYRNPDPGESSPPPYPPSTYTEAAAADQHKWNCHSYAEDYTDIWVNNVVPVLEDNYDIAMSLDDNAILDAGQGHSVKITSDVYNPPEQAGEEIYFVDGTSEKYRCSKIYSRTYVYADAYVDPQQGMFYKDN